MRDLSELSTDKFIEISKAWKENGFSFSDFYSYYSMGVSLESAIKIRDMNKNNPLLSMFSDLIGNDKNNQ